jgi:apolipoprotein N-acyltransferase
MLPNMTSMNQTKRAAVIQMALRLFLAGFGGYLSSLAMPRENIYPLIFVSVALLLLSVRNLKFFKAFTVGLVGGLAFYLSQIEWLSLYLGPVPWLALSSLEAIIFAFGMAGTALVWSWLDNSINWAKKFKPLLIAISLALIWTAREWVSISLPYGGFPWSRLAQTQSESYLADWVFLGGLGLLTFAIALIASIATVSLTSWQRDIRVPHWSALATLAFLLLVPAVFTPASNAEAGEMTIGAVQGNANAGLFANERPGTILQNHLDATELLKEKANFNKLDLVVWPENASDLSPFASSVANKKINQLVDQDLKVPLIFGTITERGEEIFNSSIYWKPDIGPTDWYDKKRPVPFAEYVPNRDFWYQLAPDLIGLVSRGYSFGERDGIFDYSKTSDSKVSKLGALICFEIAIDDIGRNLVAHGAQIILSQTNNADFGRSDETFQQAAFAKLRAIETGRVVVNVSTVGVSAIYSPDGSVIDQLPTFEPGVMLETLPLRTAITPAMLIGPLFDLLANLIAATLLAMALARTRKAAKPNGLTAAR